MSRNLWLGLIASVLVVVVAVGLLRLVDDDEIELPDELAGRTALGTPAAVKGIDDAEKADRALKGQRDATAYNQEKMSDVLDGAAVTSRTYVDFAEDKDFDDRLPDVQVLAVAADAGPLLPLYGFGDPEYLGYALPLVEWSEHGDVECLGNRVSPPGADDEDYSEEEAAIDIVTCQHRSGSLTLRVTVRDTPVDDVVDLTDDLWDDVS